MLLPSHELRKAIVLWREGSRETSGNYTWWHHPWVGLWRHSVESLRLSIWRWNLEYVSSNDQMKNIEKCLSNLALFSGRTFSNYLTYFML